MRNVMTQAYVIQEIKTLLCHSQFTVSFCKGFFVMPEWMKRTANSAQRNEKVHCGNRGPVVAIRTLVTLE